MLDSRSVRAAAKLIGVHRNTSFRWRHRFLDGVRQDQPERLAGIAEADEMYLLESQKGSRQLERPARKRGGVARPWRSRRRKPSDFIVPPGHLTQVGHPCSSTVQFLHVVVTAPTKKGTRIFILVPRILVRLAGIEPTTPWFVAKYSIQLSYSRPMHAL
ncbi:hypothetical protein MASSI9I_100151 [Massilia sp. 9I]|nr:hypothetical protein MASSI9I_100151 [Massilia sp. 9I]